MSNKRYKSGYMFELNTKHVLEKKGYYVMASRGSHGNLDLIAFNNDLILGLQLKKNCNISREELNKLYNLPKLPNMYLACLIKNNQIELKFVGKEPEKKIKEKIIYDLTNKGDNYD